MSASLAHAPRPAAAHENRHPHIEIVTSREQRRARPRYVYALVGVAGLFAIFLAQLLLSIGVSDGAYAIAKLQAQEKELARTGQALTEQLDTLGSPQNLAMNAESLGMVSNATPVYLRLSDGAVLGAAAAARGSAGAMGGASLVPNDLLEGVPLVTAAAGEPEPLGVASTEATDGSVASTTGSPAPTTPPGMLPAPVTR